MPDRLQALWRALSASQPPPPGWLVAGTAVLAVAVLVNRPAWALARHVLTLAHEASHGLAATVTGRRLGGVRLHADSSGETVSVGPARGLGLVLTTVAGYPGPALLGLGLAWLLHTGHLRAALWLGVGLLAALLLVMRNPFGFGWVLLCAALLVAVLGWGSPTGQAATAYAGCWFLLLGAPRPLFELARARRLRRERDSDPDQLAELTGLPATLWLLGMLALALSASVLGTGWLLGWFG